MSVSIIDIIGLLWSLSTAKIVLFTKFYTKCPDCTFYILFFIILQAVIDNLHITARCNEADNDQKQKSAPDILYSSSRKKALSNGWMNPL